VSYLFIAIVWTNHHHLLRYATEATPRLMWLNFALNGATADRPQLRTLTFTLSHGDVVIIQDRLSCDTTDLLAIAREMQRAGAGIRSLAELFLVTTFDFAEIVVAILGVAAKQNIGSNHGMLAKT